MKKLSALEADKTEREAALAREEAFRSEAAEVSAPEYAEGGTPQTAPSAPETTYPASANSEEPSTSASYSRVVEPKRLYAVTVSL